MLRLQAAQLPATVFSFYAKITSLNFALSAEVHFLRNSKAVLQEWNNAAVKQAFPF